MKIVHKRTKYTYRCKVCGQECFSERIPFEVVTLATKTQRGSYGDDATPPPTQYVEELYVASTISFTAASDDDPAKISDSVEGFSDNRVTSGNIRIESTSGTNDGDYTIADRGKEGRGTLLLSSDDSLTTETAASAGEVTISRIIYEPDVQRGCPFCGSLKSK